MCSPVIHNLINSESGDTYPPLGYIAQLALLVNAQYAPEAAIQDVLLAEVNRAIRGRSAYESEPALRTWGSLTHCAQEYFENPVLQNQAAAETEPVEQPSNQVGFWGVSPDVTDFANRHLELETLRRWIIDAQCRLIGIIGMGGMGKSMLAKKIALEVAADFDYVVSLSLQVPLSVEQMLVECLRYTCRTTAGEIPTTLNGLLNQTIEALRQHRCLIVLDNFESVLKSYDILLSHWGRASHKSCVLITSRQKPTELSIQEGADSPVRSLVLDGVDIATARMVLQRKSLSGTEEVWRDLVQGLSGNPMALEMTGSTVRDFYAGDIARFLDDADTLIMGNVRNLVAEQFEKLNNLEQRVLYWLAIEQEPRLVGALHTHFAPDIARRDLFESLHALQQRALVVQAEAGFSLHEIVQSYLLDRLVDQMSAAIVDQEIERLNQYPLLIAQSQEYARQAQIVRILQPVIERIRTALHTPEQQVERFAALLTELRQQVHKSGYAAGNLFNLARNMNLDLQQLDFSALPVWQAYMMGVALPDGQFRQADLRHSVFTQVFDSVRCMAFNHDGSLLATGTITGELQLWRLLAHQQVLSLPAHTDWVNGIEFSEDQNYLYSAGADGLIIQWDVQAGQAIRTLQSHAGRILTLAISADGALLASGGDDSCIRLWEAETGVLLRVCEVPLANWVHQISLHPSEPLLMSGDGDGMVRWWDTRTGQCMTSQHRHASWVWGVAVSPDGSHCASCGNDGMVYVWRMAFS